MELKCLIQNYAWGKQGMDSMVAVLMKSSDPDFIAEEYTPYAELWMGTHPNGPSFLKDQNIPLDKHIQKNSHILGNAVENTYGTKLPFLFKVLSIKRALSIQVHPNKVYNFILVYGFFCVQNSPGASNSPTSNTRPQLLITLLILLNEDRPHYQKGYSQNEVSIQYFWWSHTV